MFAVEIHQRIYAGDKALLRQLTQELHAIEKGCLAAKTQWPDQVKCERVPVAHHDSISTNFHRFVVDNHRLPAELAESVGQPLMVVVVGFVDITNEKEYFGHEC